MTNSQNIPRGASFIVASELSFALSAVIIKFASNSLPNESIVFFRSVFGLAILLPLIVKTSINTNTNILKTDRLHLHLLRGGIGIGGMYSFFYSIGQISLADSVSIKSTIPLIIPFVSGIWLQEKITRQIVTAGAIGFIGVFLILEPNGNVNWGSLVALFSSFMAALGFVTVRKLSATEPPLRIVFYFTISSVIISSLPMIWHWQSLTLVQGIMLLGIGLTTTAAQLLLTRGYQSAPASIVGIFTYTSVPFGTFLGWLIWNELLDINSLFGAILIVLAGLIILKTKAVN